MTAIATQLTQKIERLNPQTIEEVSLFVDFLLHKQQNGIFEHAERPEAVKPKESISTRLKTLDIPVSQCRVDRSDFEQENVGNVLQYAGSISDEEAAEMKQSVQEAFGNIEGDW